MKRRMALAVLILLAVWQVIYSQDKVAPKPAEQPKTLTIKPIPNELKEFFSGQWKGSGEFANGRKIEATASFTPDLDNQWLMYRHTDQEPNKFKAVGMWGFDRDSDKFLMTLHDNFGGARLFLSDGWQGDKIVF